MIDLFISYATKDSQIAYRLFGDIIKSGGKAYLYERQDTLVNFEKEIKVYIESTRGFCLIDSQAARNAKYVKYECHLALEQEHILKNNLFFVLLTEPNKGTWRKINKLFKPINLIKYIDLSHTDYKSSDDKRYDYFDRYYNGVSKICKKLRLSFAMPHPGIKDFDKELNMFDINGEIADQLQSDYKSLLSNYGYRNKKFEKRAELILDDCDELNIKVVSPYLVIGSYQLQKQEFDSAKSTYLKIISKFKEDPRGWVGLSYSVLGLGDIKNSLEAINEAENLISNNKENPNLLCHYPNVIHNKIKLLIACQEYKQARILINSLDQQFLKLYEFKILNLLLYINEGKFLSKLKLYYKLTAYYNNNIISNNEHQLIADLEHNIGRYFSSNGEYLKSIDHYQNAINHYPKNIQFYAEMAQIYYVLNDFKNELRMIIKKFSGYKANNASDSYYLGLIKYLNKEYRYAKKLFRASSELKYKYYSKLLPKKNFLSSFLRI